VLYYCSFITALAIVSPVNISIFCLSTVLFRLCVYSAPLTILIQCIILTVDVEIVMRPSYSPHYASYSSVSPSVCLSYTGLVTGLKTNRGKKKSKLVRTWPAAGALILSSTCQESRSQGHSVNGQGRCECSRSLSQGHSVNGQGR